MITIQQMIDAKACYSRERLESLWAGRGSLTAIDVLRLDVPWTDALWALHNAPAAVPIQAWQLWAIDCATRALQYTKNPAAKAALVAAVDYLDGRISIKELRAARAAAYAAADAAYAAAAAIAAADARNAAGTVWDAADDEPTWQRDQLIQLLQIGL